MMLHFGKGLYGCGRRLESLGGLFQADKLLALHHGTAVTGK